MDGWKKWEGKKVFIILKNDRQYQGVVIEVEINHKTSLAWITIRDKYNNSIGFNVEEIKLIQEEDSTEMKGGEEE
jgi:small nuclear ribonucleoprotein (snRNP)-like protein